MQTYDNIIEQATLQSPRHAATGSIHGAYGSVRISFDAQAVQATSMQWYEAVRVLMSLRCWQYLNGFYQMEYSMFRGTDRKRIAHGHIMILSDTDTWNGTSSLPPLVKSSPAG